MSEGVVRGLLISTIVVWSVAVPTSVIAIILFLATRGSESTTDNRAKHEEKNKVTATTTKTNKRVQNHTPVQTPENNAEATPSSAETAFSLLVCFGFFAVILLTPVGLVFAIRNFKDCDWPEAFDTLLEWFLAVLLIGLILYGSPTMSRGTTRPMNSCGSCGHTWFPRGSNYSAKCPHCGSVR